MRVPERSLILRTLLAASAFAAAAAAHSQVADASRLALPAPAQAARAAGGGNEQVQLFVRLADKPLAAVAGNKKTGLKLTADQQRAYSAQLAQKQAALMAQISALGGRQLGSATKAGNALVVEIAASQSAAVSGLPGVAQVLPMIDLELDLSQTVPYIGAAAAHLAGTDGTGVRVAVLDSGIDFMHYNLGGTGSVADFNTCYAQRDVAPAGICANYFGSGAPKVIGGFDFVGEAWTGGTGSPPLAPDPNPIARAGTGGHGTHVADIIAGRSADGLHKGVAPGAKVYGVKVCSAVSSSCSGLAILQGMEWSLDPNQDGDLSDAVDVVNMSLGLSYGQREHPSVSLLNAMSQFGVLTVVSAGNSANRPFITGSPSVAVSSISVAQTHVPSSTIPPLIVSAPASIARTISNTNTVAWALGNFAGNVRATAANPSSPPSNDGCSALPAGSLAGFVALIRRGTCAISLKVENAAAAGAVGVIVDNNAPGDPPSFSQGSAGPFVPTLILSQSDGNLLRGRLAAGDTVTVATGAPLAAVGSLVTTSSRGPTMGTGMIKPDIGAPGASLSAEVGTGNGETVFGGTSGAAPMVAGSAALILQRYPMLQPHEVKARLMNAAETNITTYAGPASATNPLAPITRIGAGEVRVNDALALSTAAWDASDPAAVSLSMGLTRNSGVQTIRKRVLVRNYGNASRTYTIGRGFRYANDQASGGVTLSAPASITVPANGTATFIVSATVNAANLPNWQATGINGGSNGGDASLLDLPEYDGYITIADATDTVRLPWHILPHRAHNVAAPATVALNGAPSANMALSNSGGAVDGRGDIFYLTGTSPQLPASSLPVEGDAFTITDLRAAGVRLVSLGGGAFGAQFAVNTWGARSHPNYPARISVFIDQDGNGTDDFEVWTQENSGFAATGQNVTFVRKIASNTGSGFFFTDADLASGNVILTIPLAANLAGTGPALALTPTSTFSYRVTAFDNYFTGAATDAIGPMQINLGDPRFFPSSFAINAPIGVGQNVTVNRNAAGDAVSPSQTGLLLMYRDGRFGREADTVTVTP
jgi:hypothetical protein